MVSLQGQPGASPFDFDESKIFHKFDLCTKRCKKLITMFGTIHQFSSLAQYTHLDGLDQMIKNFYNIVDDIKRKPYDLLDFYKTQFDRDFLEFNVNIHDLELALQGFINASFKQISSTEHSLNLLRQFQVILVRDSLKVSAYHVLHAMLCYAMLCCAAPCIVRATLEVCALVMGWQAVLRGCETQLDLCAEMRYDGSLSTLPICLGHQCHALCSGILMSWSNWHHSTARRVLQADLAAKYVDIFHKYGLDLEEVQKLYEKHKHAPPVVRNAPPVAGNIMWARQLLRRIEMPMKRSVSACLV